MSFLLVVLASTLQANAATEADMVALLPAVHDGDLLPAVHDAWVDLHVVVADPPDPDADPPDPDADPPDPDFEIDGWIATLALPFAAEVDKTLTFAFDEASTGIARLELVDAYGRRQALDGGAVAVKGGNFDVVAVLGDGRELFVKVDLGVDGGDLDVSGLVAEATRVAGYPAAVEIDVGAYARKEGTLSIELGLEDAAGPIEIR